MSEVTSGSALVSTLMVLSMALVLSREPREIAVVSPKGTTCTFICCPDTMRHSPGNYLLLALFTLGESISGWSLGIAPTLWLRYAPILAPRCCW